MPHRTLHGRVALAALVWLGATAFGLLVATGTRIGPVLVHLSYNHGIHAGDVLAFGGAYLLAGLVTLALLEPVPVRLDRR